MFPAAHVQARTIRGQDRETPECLLKVLYQISESRLPTETAIFGHNVGAERRRRCDS